MGNGRLPHREDERVTQALDYLKQGQSRHEVAIRFNLANSRSLDQYMRRHGYVWYENYLTYVMSPQHPNYDENRDPIRQRLSAPRLRQITERFSRPGADAKQIADDLGFETVKEMARFMEARGYAWNSEVRNYIRVRPRRGSDQGVEVRGDGKKVVGQDDDLLFGGQDNKAPMLDPVVPSEVPQVDWGKYVPLLEYLMENQVKLTKLFDQTPRDDAEIPRFAIPGPCGPKSIQMTDGLKRLVEDFSKEKNLRQRDIVEAALVEFLRKYGYGPEVEAFLMTS